jgi:hypothetical protein
MLAALMVLLGAGVGAGAGAGSEIVLGSVGLVPAAGADGPAPPAPPGPENNSSYAIVDAAGGVLTYGGAGYEGDTLALSLQKPIVGAAADPNGGYWLVASDGGIFTFGGTQFYGSTGSIRLNKPIVGMAPTKSGNGYWIVASDGGIFAFGDAPFYGSTGALKLNKPIVGMAATPDGQGYWLVASDGGIFTFGDAQFYGSTGALTLNKPIVGMASTGTGGYWLVASDGGIFAFGNANFWGSTGAISLNAPIVGMAATPSGLGYWLVGSDAGVFTFGDAQFAGSAQSPLHPPLFPAGFSQTIPPVVAITPDTHGPQASHQGRLRVAFAGDSIAFYEGEYTFGTNPAYFIDNGAAPGCGFTNGGQLIPWSAPTTVYTDPIACALWTQQLQWLTSRFHPDVTVIQLGYWEAQDRLFDGVYQTLNSASFSSYIESNINNAVQIAHANGGNVVLATSPYFADGTPNSLINQFNAIVQTVVNQNSSFVSLYDTFTALDPGGAYSSIVNGVLARTPDGVHVTQSGVEVAVDPGLNSVVIPAGNAVFGGTA